MTTAQREALEQRVMAILREASGRPLTLPQIEEKLAVESTQDFDTFDVRNAVWRLIENQDAEFTPRREVILPRE